jgi:hypothetical protein
MATTTRFIGNCQICEGDQKLHNERMVHHGYKRPGHGSIEGDCPGVDEVPYETSCELIKAYKLRIEAQLVNLTTYLADLKAGKITHITEYRIYRSRKSEFIEYHAGVTAPHTWSSALQSKTYQIESSIEQCRFTIERCARRIAAWKPMPIRTVEEEQAKADADKAARKAVVDAARAARAAKKAATKAKQEALEARRTAIMDDFRSQIRALVESPESDEARKAAAVKLAQEMKKSKYSWMSIYRLGCDQEFVKLGLARPEKGYHDREYVTYLWPLR